VAFRKKTLGDAPVSGGTRVLVRADLNVPLDGGAVSDDTRIRAALPTIEDLRGRGARVVLCSHLGRPKGRESETSLAPVSERLAELIGAPVEQAPVVIGAEVEERAAALAPGGVLVLENTRWEEGETANGPDLARALAALGDIYVNDAFGAAHRAHASTAGVAEHLPSYAGFLLEREVTTLEGLVADPARPLVVVLGGAKVTDKIGLIERFLDLADTILIGGAMCFSFFRAQGMSTGDSLVHEPDVVQAAVLLAKAEDSDCELALPLDLVIADEFSADAESRPSGVHEIPAGWMGLDVGEETRDAYARVIGEAGTVFWNGPMGAFELDPFAAGTRAVADAIAAAPGTTVVGGGDSAAALVQFGLGDSVDHLSTGGGASLELLEGKKLPGVEALDDA